MKVSRTENLVLHEIAASNKRMETALFGDDRAGIEGVIGTIKKHGKAIEQYKSDRTKIMFGLSGLAIVFELLKEKIKDLF